MDTKGVVLCSGQFSSKAFCPTEITPFLFPDLRAARLCSHNGVPISSSCRSLIRKEVAELRSGCLARLITRRMCNP